MRVRVTSINQSFYAEDTATEVEKKAYTIAALGEEEECGSDVETIYLCLEVGKSLPADTKLGDEFEITVTRAG